MTLKPEVNLLRECVRMTMQPDINIKKRAEKELEEISRRPGFLTTLLELSASDADASVRMFTALYFRRYLEKFWSVDGFDKASIIKEFPYILHTASKEGEKQLLVSLQFILKSEEVEQWAPIIKKTEELVKSADPSAVMIGLKILNKIVLGFIEEYKAEKEFEMLFDPVGDTLLNIIVTSVKTANAEMAAFAMKVLGHSCESYMLPNVFKQPVFVQNLISVVDLTITSLFASASAVKWSCMVINGLIKKTKKKKDLPSFALFERSDVLSLLYKKSVEILTAYGKAGNSPKVEAQAFEMVRNIISKSAGWEIVKNDTPMITTQFILPAVSFTEEMEDSWDACQIDFMRENEARYIKNAATLASELFLDIAKKANNSPDKQLFEYLFNVIINEISAYTATQSPPVEAVRMRYGGLCLFKIAGKYIRNNETVFSIIINDISAPHAIIKYIAFSTLHHLSYYGGMPKEVLDPFMDAVKSKDLGVVVESALCLPNILAVDSMQAKLKQYIPEFIRLLLDLSNRIQIEALATTLEDVIMMCAEESSTIAPGIAEAISGSIVSLLKESAQEGENGEEEPEERYEVIDGYIRTITTLIDSVGKSPESVLAIMQPVRKMIITVGTEYPDFFPDLFPLLVVASYNLKSVDGLYEILEIILKMPIDDMAIYINELSSVFDNFITYGKEGMLKYLHVIFSILSEMMQGIITDYDFPYLCRIIESILLNASRLLGDKLGEFIKAAVTLVLSDREMLESSAALISAIEIVLCSIILMPGHTISALHELKVTSFVFGSLDSSYKKFERVHDLKLLLLSSGILISQQEKSLPSEISVETLMKVFIFAIESFPEALARREALKNENELDYEDEESYGETECFDEDPSFETPLDAIDPYDYARNICSLGPGTIVAGAWSALPEEDKQNIIKIIRQKQ
ncbi:importin-7 [Nematocida minor]|uniref:importin-7 n=1 Tax=Nematocida minor TaxID=1912983 RepID=UPI0022201DE2|nr:importin-7 [Nematocida minor]KAI5191982.1 importin-7 [Nematocida minor]